MLIAMMLSGGVDTGRREGTHCQMRTSDFCSGVRSVIGGRMWQHNNWGLGNLTPKFCRLACARTRSRLDLEYWPIIICLQSHCLTSSGQ